MSSKLINANATLTAYAFDVLFNRFDSQKYPLVIPDDFPKDVSCPLFITWKKFSGQSKSSTPSLRGCIGTYENLALKDGVKDFALKSAFSDFRFSPMHFEEIPFLQCSVSLLHSFEDGKDWEDWEVGVHGIRIFFNHLSATYLPEVATEQGWTKEQALRSLVQKAGYYGDINSDFLKKLILKRYQSSKFTMTYDEYMIFKKN